MYYVYEWFIEETGEVIYVGKGTRNRYKVRKHNRFFNDMIRRYKCSSRIVKEFENEDDAFKYEFDRVVELKCKGQCVCNINPGGSGGETKWWTEDRRKWYSENNVMKSKEQRERMSVNNPMKNKEIARVVGEKHGRKICVEDKVYNSLREVSEAYNMSPQAFFYWLKRGYTNDHERCYYYGENPRELQILDYHYNKVKKRVIIDGIEYESINAGARAIGSSGSWLLRSLRDGKQVKGHTCKYAD